MSIHNDIRELVDQGVITQQTAADIQAYYHQKKEARPSRLFLIFGVLGALLVGLGIILILAHNWDQLSRFTKTCFAFLPLLIGQGLAAFSLVKRKDDDAWREGSAVFLLFAIGACIALISQIYHLPGSMDTFFLTWILLALPIIYVLDSSMASILYSIGSTAFVIAAIADRSPTPSPHWYWVLMAALMLYYYHMIKKRWTSPSTFLHHWLVPLSMGIGWVVFAREESLYPLIGYMSLASAYYLLGNFNPLKSLPLVANGYRVIGAVGIIVILLILSFEPPWEWLSTTVWDEHRYVSIPIINMLMFAIAYILLAKHWKDKTVDEHTPLMVIFVLFFLLVLFGQSLPATCRLLTNVIILATAILTIRKGVAEDHLGILNFGLLIMTALLICRFFDTDISFVLRGLLFILVGISFFIANSILLKRRRS